MILSICSLKFDFWNERTLFYLSKMFAEQSRKGEHQTGEDIVKWMRFFNGKSRKEFEDMAQADIYMGEAYEALKRLSADEKKRLEYEAREKALRDYNCQINCAEKRGEERGRTKGRREGRAEEIIEMGKEFGLDDEVILRRLKERIGFSLEEATAYLDQYKKQLV